MSPEDRKYYDLYFDLFASDGWKQLIEDVKKEADYEKQTAAYVGSTDEFLVRKGRVQLYDWILNMPQIVEHNYKNLTDDEKSDDVEDL